MATVLNYQSSNGLITLTLPSPDFDNTEKLDFDRINRKTRGGDLIVFRDSIWTATKTLVYKFSYIPQVRINQLLQFMRLTMGLTIELIDFEGFVWNGIIMTPSGEVSQPGRENFTAQFEFQGSIVE